MFMEQVAECYWTRWPNVLEYAPTASSLLLEQLESCHAINNSMIVGVGAGIQ